MLTSAPALAAVVVILSGHVIAEASVPWSPLSPVAQESSRERLSTALAGLSAAGWERRAENLGKLEQEIAADSSLRKRTEIQHAVAAALARDNAYIRERYRRSGESGSSVETMPYSEDRSAYYTALIELALRLVDHGTPETKGLLLEAIVNGAYNSDSAIAKGVALKGEDAVPAVEQLARGTEILARGNGYALMGEMLRVTNTGETTTPLSARSQMRLRGVLRAGLRCEDAVLCQAAIGAVVAAGDREAIPLLSKIFALDVPAAKDRRWQSWLQSLSHHAITTLQRPR